MNTPCPHCHVRIEIDPATHAALATQSHFACPACQGTVPLPALGVQLYQAPGTHATTSASHRPRSIATASGKTSRNFLILGATALLVLGGIAFVLASRKSSDTHITTQNIRNEIINNSYFQNLIATGVTTKADLEAIADIRPLGKNFMGVSLASLTWAEARQLADRTGSQILPVADGNSTAQTELFAWVEDKFAGLLSPSPWVSNHREAAILANSEAFQSNEINRKGKVILYWQTDIRVDEAEMKARRTYKNLGRSALDEKIVFGPATNSNLLWPKDFAFDGVSQTLEVISENRPFPVYQSLWDEENVFIIHPATGKTPGTVDFSEITGKSRGELIIKVRDHLHGDCRIEITKNSKSLKLVDLNTNDWQTIQIPFDEDNVILKIHATGWSCEHAFVTYEFAP